MSYTIRHFDKSNTTPALTVNDKKVDKSTTTLSFYGLNSVDFGLGLNENYLHLMEHFCDKDITIAKLVPGQLWFDKSISRMKIWTGNKWHILKESTTNKFPKGFVTIVGNIVNGATVSTANTLADEDGLGDFSYQWYLDSNKIANATDSTYTIVLSDVGHNLGVSLSYIDGSHNRETVYSKEYPVNSAANHLPTGSLTIDGTVAIGEILTAIVNNIQDADGFIGGNFGWVLNGVDIPGENNPTYIIKVGDAGGTLKAKYYYVDLNNNNETVYSNPVVVSYAITTTTTPITTTTTIVIPDTSALQSQITLCNATVPILKDTWFTAETDRVTTEQLLAAEYQLGDDADNLSRRIALGNSDDAAIAKVKNTYDKWIVGVNACISNKNNLFTTLKDASSALSLTQAFQYKLETQKSAIDNAISLYSTAVNDYSTIIGKDVSENRTDTTLGSRIALSDLYNSDLAKYGAWNAVAKYISALDSTFTDAINVNLTIVSTLNTSSAVTTVTTLAQYKTTTLKDIYDKLKVVSDATNAKYASVDGNTGIDLGARLEWQKLRDSTHNYTVAAQNKWTTSVTDGVNLTTTANNLLT